MKVVSFLLLLLAGCSTPEKPKAISIEHGLKNLAPKFRQCFMESDSYKGHAHKESRLIRVSFRVNDQGEVEDGAIFETEFKDPNFHSCVLTQLKNLKVSPPEGGAINVISKPLEIGRPKE